MSGITEPSLNPLATTTQSTSTTAPDWYNSFLSGQAADTLTAATRGGVAGASGLQTAAYSAAPTAIAAGQPALSQATNVAQNAATGPDISAFMNPYTSGVVNEIGRLGARNYNEYLKPAATAATVGSGQFGSRRGMQVQGQVGRDVAADVLGKQTGALQSGFSDAVKNAILEQQTQDKLAGTLSNISTNAYTQGVGGLDALSKLGAQQQTTEQARINYPMTALGQRADILRGFTVPTGTTQTTTTPAGTGQTQLSPLNQIGALVGSLGTFGSQPASNFISGLPAGSTQTLANYLTGKLSSMFGGSGGSGGSGGGGSVTVPAGWTDNGDGSYSKPDGSVVNLDGTPFGGGSTGGGTGTTTGGNNDTTVGGVGDDTITGSMFDNDWNSDFQGYANQDDQLLP
jgi:hypothetical protein